jgi:Dolichyl-phosphate-mannose-protein mannosyltransferase
MPASAGVRRHLFIAVALLLAYVLQCAWFARTQSITFDESIHTAVAQDVWRNHRFDQWMETPPLGHLLLGLPIYGDKYQMEIRNPAGWLMVTALTPGPKSFILGPRMVNVALGVMLGILVWCAARDLFSLGAANFALALFAFSPQFIAHFTVATVDGVGVLTVFAVALQLARWRRNPSWGQTLLLGATLGVALIAKFYAPPFVVLALMAVLFTRKTSQAGEVSASFSSSPSDWSWKLALAALFVAGLVVWSGYFFHVGKAVLHDRQLVISYPQSRTTINVGGLGLDLGAPLPAPEFFAGFHEVMVHNRLGHPSFFLGRVSYGAASRWYFPVVIALKWPTITLALALAGVILVLVSAMLRLRPGTAIDLAVYGGFGVVAALLALWSRLGIGDRHVLTLYPLLLIFSAACWHWAAGLTREKGRIALGALALLAALNAADVMRYAPGYLSYFNVFVPAERSRELLTDSSLDWGQGLLALRQYQQEHPNVPLHLAYFGSVDPRLYGIQSVPLRPGERVSGTVVVSATMLSGQYLSDPNGYHWLLQFKPVGVLDHCLFVFEVPQG